MVFDMRIIRLLGALRLCWVLRNLDGLHSLNAM